MSNITVLVVHHRNITLCLSLAEGTSVDQKELK